jgi:hypothetical protein
VSPRLCSSAISAAFSTWALLAPSADARPPDAIADAEPTSPWQPTSAPEMEALRLIKAPIAAAAKKNASIP